MSDKLGEIYPQDYQRKIEGNIYVVCRDEVEMIPVAFVETEEAAILAARWIGGDYYPLEPGTGQFVRHVAYLNKEGQIITHQEDVVVEPIDKPNPDGNCSSSGNEARAIELFKTHHRC